MVSLHPFSDNDPFKYSQMLLIFGSVSNYLWSVCFDDQSLLKINLVQESAEMFNGYHSAALGKACITAPATLDGS